jgi:hypothetical protein
MLKVFLSQRDASFLLKIDKNTHMSIIAEIELNKDPSGFLK